MAKQKSLLFPEWPMGIVPSSTVLPGAVQFMRFGQIPVVTILRLALVRDIAPSGKNRNPASVELGF